jgi:predicted anti-sigma-YlaC factor YlaD
MNSTNILQEASNGQSCEPARRWLVGHFLGDLTPKQEAKLQRHLEKCEACRKKLEILERAWEETR